MGAGQNEKMFSERRLASARMLVSRLERLSADSYWAHQASGLRGSLLRCLQRLDLTSGANTYGTEGQPDDKQRLDELVERGFAILALAARSMRRPTSRSLKR
jgi:hypothetical protein